jgi:hypothetical protein
MTFAQLLCLTDFSVNATLLTVIRIFLISGILEQLWVLPRLGILHGIAVSYTCFDIFSALSSDAMVLCMIVLSFVHFTLGSNNLLWHSFA